MEEGYEGRALALIAGAGSLPSEAARLLRRQGRSLCAIAFSDVTTPDLEVEVEDLRWLRLGQLDAMAEALHDLGAANLLLIGKVSKRLLYDGQGIVDPDEEAMRLLAAERDRGDEPLMLSIARWLEGRGFHVCDQGETLESMLADEGQMSDRAPNEIELGDFNLGWPIVQNLGQSGIGQCVVVKHGSVLAVEAIEGTDATIRRAGDLGGAGATVIKAARPGQDRRFDLPAVGVGTIEALRLAGATALAIEAGSTLILDREEMISAANRAEIAVWGFLANRDGS